MSGLSDDIDAEASNLEEAWRALKDREPEHGLLAYFDPDADSLDVHGVMGLLQIPEGEQRRIHILAEYTERIWRVADPTICSWCRHSSARGGNSNNAHLCRDCDQRHEEFEARKRKTQSV